MNPLKHSRSLRKSLNTIVVAATVVALAFAGVALLAFDLRTQARNIGNDLSAQADIIGLASSAALAFEDVKAATENLSALRANPSVTHAALFSEDRRQFATYTRNPAAQPATARQIAGGTELNLRFLRVYRPVIFNGTRIGSVYLEAEHNLGARALEYFIVLGAILLASLLAALVLAGRLQRTVTEPLVALGGVAQRIKQGDFSLRAEKTSQDEVGSLVDAFNAMVAELGRRAETLERANQALRASEERYQLAVRGSSAGLWDWDMRAGTMFYSPRLKQMLGYENEDFPDRPDSILLVLNPDDRPVLRAALHEHLAHDKPYQVEVRIRLRTGEERWLALAGTALRDVDGQPFRMAGSVVDVTERKQAENVLRDANRAKDEFLATLAHELRNPLAPIRTGLEILKLDRANGPASQRARETMERQLVHMIRLIDDLLDISRITSGKIRLEKSRIRLADVIGSAVEISRPVIESGKHTLHLDLPQEPIELDADATRVAQAVGNLLNNAAKYTPNGGNIWVHVERQGEEVVIEVRDDGVGIPQEMLESVFSMFAQVGKTLDRAQGGLGIGLSLVRSLVGLHGGTVTAHSEGAGLGSTFTVRLPCLPAQPTADVARSDAAALPSVDGRRVLVVDDNVDAAETLAAVLTMTGHQVRTVHDGTHVLEAARAFDPEVVLLDIGLPGLSGYEIAQQLRAERRFARTRLIAVTGWGADADRQRTRDAGFDHHLTKPIDMDALMPLIDPPPQRERAAA